MEIPISAIFRTSPVRKYQKKNHAALMNHKLRQKLFDIFTMISSTYDVKIVGKLVMSQRSVQITLECESASFAAKSTKCMKNVTHLNALGAMEQGI